MVKENYTPHSGILASMEGVKTLVDLLQFRAENQADDLACAFLTKGEELTHQMTYRELDASARAIAAKLQTTAPKGERAMMLYPSGLEFVAAFWGCLYAGIIPVPVYPPQMGKQIDRVISVAKDSQASLFLTCESVKSSLDRSTPELVSQNPKAWVVTDQIESVWADKWTDPDISPEDIAFLQYTSGSTGQPKGVCVSHGNLLYNEEMICRGFGHDRLPDVKIGGWLPLFHDMGLIGVMIQPIFLGRPTYLMSPLSFIQDPFRWLKSISDYRLTSSGGPNFGFALCVDKITDEQVAQLDLSCWKQAFCGAEPIQVETYRRFAEKFKPAGFEPEFFYPCYGMAETTLFISGGDSGSAVKTLPVDPEALTRNEVKTVGENHDKKIELVGCGHTWMEQKIIIVNLETGAKLGENQIGEIWVSGDHVAQGYWQKPELNKAVFQAYTSNTQEGPFLRTGDLGFIHENEVYITGREKDLIIIRGRNHYPQDIEKTAAESYQGLRPGGSAAFSLDVDGSEKLVIVQEIDRGVLKNTSEDEIFAAIRKEISLRHELQVYGIALIKQRSIPKTSSGKIQRKATKKAYLNDTLKVEASWVAEGEVAQVEEVVTESQLTRADIQQWIINWVAKELDIPAEKIDPEESIQAYGIDSMATARFEEEVSKFVGFTWPVMDLLINEPSIVEISEKGEELIIEASGSE